MVNLWTFMPLLAILLIGLLALALCVWGLINVLDLVDRPAQNPKQKLVNQLGRVLAPISSDYRGKVIVMGEIWDALAEPLPNQDLIPIETNAEVRVVGFDAVDPRVLRVTSKLMQSPKPAMKND
jgi:membrane protein implicated in regulation of membrane protease activity